MAAVETRESCSILHCPTVEAAAADPTLIGDEESVISDRTCTLRRLLAVNRPEPARFDFRYAIPSINRGNHTTVRDSA